LRAIITASRSAPNNASKHRKAKSDQLVRFSPGVGEGKYYDDDRIMGTRWPRLDDSDRHCVTVLPFSTSRIGVRVPSCGTEVNLEETCRGCGVFRTNVVRSVNVRRGDSVLGRK
jgi:hypothetical protein